VSIPSKTMWRGNDGMLRRGLGEGEVHESGERGSRRIRGTRGRSGLSARRRHADTPTEQNNKTEQKAK
jgi:hypothetical protein